MNPINTLAALIDNPGLLVAAERPEGLGRTGLLGYLAGTLGVFAWLRMYSAVPPGFLSFTAVLLCLLGLNFLMAALLHLFMDLTGARGGAARLFLAFGCTDFLMSLLIPMAFFAKLNLVGAFVAYSACVALLVYARVRIVKRVYAVSANKAALGVLLPYAWLGAAAFVASVYSLAWLVWLVV